MVFVAGLHGRSTAELKPESATSFRAVQHDLRRLSAAEWRRLSGQVNRFRHGLNGFTSQARQAQISLRYPRRKTDIAVLAGVGACRASYVVVQANPGLHVRLRVRHFNGAVTPSLAHAARADRKFPANPPLKPGLDGTPSGTNKP